MNVNIINHSFDQILPSFKRTLMSDYNLFYIFIYLAYLHITIYISLLLQRKTVQHRTGSQFSKENENDY